MVKMPALVTAMAITATAAAADPGDASAPDAVQCADRISLVRAERGLPPLAERNDAASGMLFDRRPAKPEEGLLFSAVDHRLDGCGVLVMHNNPRDIRPVPQPQARGTMFQR